MSILGILTLGILLLCYTVCIYLYFKNTSKVTDELQYLKNAIVRFTETYKSVHNSEQKIKFISEEDAIEEASEIFAGAFVIDKD